MSCNVDEYHNLINLIKMHAEDYRWDETIMVIPKEMTAVENAERILLLTHHGKVMIKMIHVYKDLYIHMQTCMAQDVNMLFKCLFSSLSKEGRNQVQLERSWKYGLIDILDVAIKTYLGKIKIYFLLFIYSLCRQHESYNTEKL
jgi:hypothetical protein